MAASLIPLVARDPRTRDWWFVGGNVPLLVAILSTYVYFVKVVGPRFMRDRKPMDHLKPLIVFYNGAMTVTNIYFCYHFFRRSYFGGGYSFLCQGIDFEARDETTMELLELCWWYLWVRVADFLDTVFFVLRKKDAHVSFFHVVHHCLVVFNGWYGAGYGPDGQVMLVICLNSFVHVFMYSYYLLSLLGPSVKKYLWWKRYLTQLQIVQFLILCPHGIVPLFKDCGYPKMHVYLAIPQGIFFLGNLVNFYREAYNRKRSERISQKAE
ncbi:very long chain fatty acid elongase AAEL008004-like [Ornithodoros turicata]|uniref:very long chain fatty acid elongase AAEL008004-like n=1 Tax=Ornithodoros turicata TaxID=34597 RepID=UPI00313A4417